MGKKIIEKSIANEEMLLHSKMTRVNKIPIFGL